MEEQKSKAAAYGREKLLKYSLQKGKKLSAASMTPIKKTVTFAGKKAGGVMKRMAWQALPRESQERLKKARLHLKQMQKKAGPFLKTAKVSGKIVQKGVGAGKWIGKGALGTFGILASRTPPPGPGNPPPDLGEEAVSHARILEGLSAPARKARNAARTRYLKREKEKRLLRKQAQRGMAREEEAFQKAREAFLRNQKKGPPSFAGWFEQKKEGGGRPEKQNQDFQGFQRMKTHKNLEAGKASAEKGKFLQRKRKRILGRSGGKQKKKRLKNVGKEVLKALLTAVKRKIVGGLIGAGAFLLVLIAPFALILALIDSPSMILEILLGEGDREQQLIDNTLRPAAEELECLYMEFDETVAETAVITEEEENLPDPPLESVVIYPDTIERMPNFIDVFLCYVSRIDSFSEGIEEGILKDTFQTMCRYTVNYQTRPEEDGTSVRQKAVTVTYLQINDLLKSGTGEEYAAKAAMMDAEQKRKLAEAIGRESIEAGEGGSVPEDLKELTKSLQGKQKALVEAAITAVGTPYSQAYRNEPGYYDCSSLTRAVYRTIGIDLSYQGSDTAAAQAQGLQAAGKTIEYAELRPGDLIFYAFGANGRFMNISHAAIYVGNGLVIDTSSNMGAVGCRPMPAPENIVLCARPIPEEQAGKEEGKP